MAHARVRSTAAILFAMVATSSPLPSQSTSGHLEGVIRAATGVPLVGARVIVVGTAHTVRTDSAGRYRISDVVPGLLAMRAQLVGYKSSTVEGIRLAGGQTIRQDFAMAESKATTESVPGLTAVAINGIEHASIRTFGPVEGCIRTAAGLPVRAAHIEFIGLNRSAATDTTGYYAIDKIPGGIVAIRVRAEGYLPVLIEGLRLMSRAVRQDVTLTAAGEGRNVESQPAPQASQLYRGGETTRQFGTAVSTRTRSDRLGGAVRSDVDNTFVDGVPFQNVVPPTVVRTIACTR